MAAEYWVRMQQTDFAVPLDRSLTDLTAELTTMLGSTDADLRDEIAYPTLATWIDRGIYDDLLPGLGDGMTAGLLIGLGEDGTDSVFRRSFSALVLAECISRDNERRLVPATQVLDWADRLATWFLREKDTRGWVEGKGWAHTIAHGADALGTLANSASLGASELGVLLDVLADRLLDPGTAPLLSGEPDRLASAAMNMLRRNVIHIDQAELWVNRLATAANAYGLGAGADHFPAALNPQAFLRALFVHLNLAPNPPADRADLLLITVEALRSTNAPYLVARTPQE